MVSGMREMEQDEIELKDISAREVGGVMYSCALWYRFALLLCSIVRTRT